MNDFIKWNGGPCPMPAETKVRVLYRDGGISPVYMRAGHFRWTHSQNQDDVVGYKLTMNDSPHQPGVKLDDAKPRPDLIFDGFSLALMEVSKVAAFGAAKYIENGWASVPDARTRYRAAGDRHRLIRQTEQLDTESNLLHLAHEAWNRLAELELLLRNG